MNLSALFFRHCLSPGLLFLSAAMPGVLAGQPPLPENLVAEGIPAIPEELKAGAGRYLEFRSASFLGWHPLKREMLISTRFADTAQLHLVKMPGGARRQLTFSDEPIRGGAYRPLTGDTIVYSRDTGGGEFFQLYSFSVSDGRSTLLTDGTSRNAGARWSRNGKLIAYTSTRRTGKDNDIRILSPGDPASGRLLLEVQGGGWGISDWSPDDTRLIVSEFISAN
jgi:hypothetical protein